MKLIIFDTWQVVYIHSFVPQLSMFKLSYPLIPTPRPIHALDDNDHPVLTRHKQGGEARRKTDRDLRLSRNRQLF